MKNILKRKRGNNGFRFSVVVLLLLFLLQGQLNQLYAADKTQSTQKEPAYPATPEGVVEDEHRRQYSYYEYHPYVGEDYFLREANCEADCEIMVNSFAVKKLTQSKDKAKVMIEFDVVGTFSLGYVGEKEDYGHTLTKTEAGECNEFDIFKTTGGKFDKGVIFYDLVRKKGKWKIVPKWEGCPVVYVSIGVAIKFIEDKMRFIKDDSIKKRNLKIIDRLRGLQKTDK